MTVAAVLMLCTGSVFTDLFNDANTAYNNEDFPAAVHAYEQLVANGVEDAVVFFNLGNAYYRQGALGPAIANYERALRVRPGFEAARDNLAHTLAKTERNLARPLPPAWEQTLLFWHYQLTWGASTALALLFWVVAWGLLAVRQVRVFPYLRRGAFVMFALGAGFGTSAWAKANPETLAVAREETVPVRYGTSDSETIRFELFEGDRVTVDAQRGDWARVVTVDGERGWARASALYFVGPPYENAAPAPHSEESAR